jgi:hypothetical protein
VTRAGLPTVVWVLVALLLGSALLMLVGAPDERFLPTAGNYAPSGTAAFAELIRRDGYQVAVDTAPKPVARPGDLQIFFWLGADAGPAEPPRSSAKRLTFAVSAAAEPYTQQAQSQLDGSQMQVSVDGTALPGVTGRLPLWTAGGDQFTITSCPPSGLQVRGFAGATNRYIDQADNAAFALWHVRRLARPGGRVVFCEAAYAQSNPSLAQQLGPWAVALKWQAILFAAVVLYTVSRRFGLPSAQKAEARGTREFVDGLADTMLRAKHSDWALRLIIEDAERKLRHARGKSPAADEAVLDAKDRANAKPIPAEAAAIARKLESNLAESTPTKARHRRRR